MKNLLVGLLAFGSISAFAECNSHIRYTSYTESDLNEKTVKNLVKKELKKKGYTFDKGENRVDVVLGDTSRGQYIAVDINYDMKSIGATDSLTNNKIMNKKDLLRQVLNEVPDCLKP